MRVTAMRVPVATSHAEDSRRSPASADAARPAWAKAMNEASFVEP